jgi:hypothetical protein
MAMIIQRTKTLPGIVLVFLFVALAITAAVVLVPAVMTLGPWMWGALALVAITATAIAVQRRRVEAARERAWVGSFSFGDVVARRRAEDLRSRDA